MIKPHIFANAEKLVKSLADQFVALSNLGRPVHISLSGGTTPSLLFQCLASTNYAQNIQWQNLHLWWGDERCVAPEDAQSNYGETKRLLLDKIDIPEQNIHRIRGEDSAADEVVRFAKEMQETIPLKNNLPEFDWVLLGIGGDGHTASLFPGQTDYAEQALAVVAEHPQSGQLRISKSARLLQAAKRISYLSLGAGKAEIIREICGSETAQLPYPAAHIHTEQGITEYLIDAEAASLISLGDA